LLGHLCVEYLVYDTLQQLSHTLVSTKKLVQYLAIYGNLVLGHPLQPPVGFVDQLNHYQEGDGPSYCYAILILEFTPSYRTLLFVPRPSQCECNFTSNPANLSKRARKKSLTYIVFPPHLGNGGQGIFLC